MGWCPQWTLWFKVPLYAAWMHLFVVKWHHFTRPAFQTCLSSFIFQLCLVRDIFTGTNRRWCPGCSAWKLKFYIYFLVAAHTHHIINIQNKNFPSIAWKLPLFEVEISQRRISSSVSVLKQGYSFRIDSCLKSPVWESFNQQTPSVHRVLALGYLHCCPSVKFTLCQVINEDVSLRHRS